MAGSQLSTAIGSVMWLLPLDLFKSYYYKPTVRISVFIQNGYFEVFEEFSDILKIREDSPRKPNFSDI